MRIKLLYICLALLVGSATSARAEQWAICETEHGLCLYTADNVAVGNACSCFGDAGSIPPPPDNLDRSMGDSCLVGQNLCEISEPQALGAECTCLTQKGKVVVGPSPSEIINSPAN